MATNDLPTLLILEGHSGNRQLQSRQLTFAGHRVTTCASVEAAWAILDTTPIQLLLLEYELSGDVNGLQFFEQVCKTHPNIPVILLTDHSDLTIANEAIQLGIRDVIPRTSGYLEYLPSAVSRVLALVRTETELNVLKAHEAGADKTHSKEAQYRSLAATMTSIGWTADAKGAIVEPQARWGSYTGMDWEDYRGWGWLQAVHPDDRPNVEKHWRESLIVGKLFESRGRLRHAESGGYRHFFARVVPIIERENSIKEWIGVIMDIEGRDRADFAGRGTDSDHNYRLKDEFLSVVAHELRTPLNAILGWTQLIRRNPTPTAETLGEALEIIERNARVQSQLIEDMLDLSRIMSGKLRLDRRPHNLAAVVGEATHDSLPVAEARHIRIETHFDLDAGTANIDHHRIQQVVFNLLLHAIKSTPKGGTVTVSLCREGNSARVDVADTGLGIRRELLPHVFSRFHQSDADTTRRHGGLGIGMTIVRELVEMHSGSVHVSSEGEGQGSTFGFVIPILQIPSGPQEVDDHSGLGSASFDIEGVRILVVDHQPGARKLLNRILAKRGGTVLEAGSAEQGMDIIENQDADIIVCDIAMPDREGLEFMRNVRKLERPEHRNIPAIAVSAHSHPDDRRRAMQAGFQMFLPKPIDPGQIVILVAVLAERLSTLETP